MKQPYFYMATDDQAIQHLEKQLSVVGLDIYNAKPQIQK